MEFIVSSQLVLAFDSSEILLARCLTLDKTKLWDGNYYSFLRSNCSWFLVPNLFFDKPGPIESWIQTKSISKIASPSWKKNWCTWQKWRQRLCTKSVGFKYKTFQLITSCRRIHGVSWRWASIWLHELQHQLLPRLFMHKVFFSSCHWKHFMVLIQHIHVVQIPISKSKNKQVWSQGTSEHFYIIINTLIEKPYDTLGCSMKSNKKNE